MVECKPRLDSSHDVIAQLMWTTGRACLATGRRILESSLNSPQHHRRVHHGDHDESGRPTNAMHLPKQSIEIGDVVDHQPANNTVEGSVLKWQRLGEIVNPKNDIRLSSLYTRSFQHRLGEIERMDNRPCGRKPYGVPTCATADVG